MEENLSNMSWEQLAHVLWVKELLSEAAFNARRENNRFGVSHLALKFNHGDIRACQLFNFRRSSLVNIKGIC